MERSETGSTRREFLGQCGSALQGLLLMGAVAPIIAACDSSETTGPTGNGSVEIGVGSLDADGKFLVSDEVGPDEKKILVIRKSAGTFLALSTECTHEQCEVNPPSNNQIVCPCHGSRYNMDGGVVNGPAASPLRRYTVAYDAGRSVITVSW
jgi:Rieske Fe-S protein